MKQTRVYILVITCIMLQGINATNKLITSLEVTRNRVQVEINEEFKTTYLTSDFFAEYEDPVDLTELDYEIVTMPFIMNVISLVWISGKDYDIDSMEEELYYSLEKIKEIFKVMHPKTSWNGKLIPKKLVSLSSKYKKTKAKALLFSGGLDSTSSLF